MKFDVISVAVMLSIPIIGFLMTFSIIPAMRREDRGAVIGTAALVLTISCLGAWFVTASILKAVSAGFVVMVATLGLCRFAARRNKHDAREQPPR